MSASALRMSAGRVATRATAVLSAESIKIVKTVFKPRAEELTKHFYAKMSKNNPEVLAFFNQANQIKQRWQPHPLAQAIVAYASNIDTLGVLDSAAEAMAAQNCGLQVLPKVHSPSPAPFLPVICVYEAQG
jgi:nitric oxide dioxygenase